MSSLALPNIQDSKNSGLESFLARKKYSSNFVIKVQNYKLLQFFFYKRCILKVSFLVLTQLGFGLIFCHTYRIQIQIAF